MGPLNSNVNTMGEWLLFWYWGLNSGPSPWTTPPVLFCDGFFNSISRTICPGLASNLDPPDLCLLSSRDYRCEPPAPSKRVASNLEVDIKLNYQADVREG
jgi:hypothetical protein